MTREALNFKTIKQKNQRNLIILNFFLFLTTLAILIFVLKIPNKTEKII
jgi:hypothetical protein